MAKRPVKQGLNQLSNPVLRQSAIATLLHKLRSGEAVRNSEMKSVLWPAELKAFAEEAHVLRQERAMARDLAQDRPAWISHYCELVRKGNLLYRRDRDKGEAFFERAAEVIEENYIPGQTELWFDRPVRALFDIHAPLSDHLDSHGLPVGLSPGGMPRVAQRRTRSETLKDLKERVLRAAFDAIENRTLPAVRAALAAQKDDEEVEPE